MIKILCYGGNKNIQRIIQEYPDWKFGIRQDATSSIPVYFLDNHFLKPNKKQYLQKIRVYMPEVVTLPDVIDELSYAQYLEYYGDVQALVPNLISIPKVVGYALVTDYIGYSVPTRYAASPLPTSWYKQFTAVHLLGGNPQKQYELSVELGNVISLDQNMLIKVAYFAEYFNKQSGKWDKTYKGGKRVFELCVRKSIENISALYASSRWL